MLDITFCSTPMDVDKCENCKRNKKLYKVTNLFLESYTTPMIYIHGNVFECDMYWQMNDEYFK